MKRSEVLRKLSIHGTSTTVPLAPRKRYSAVIVATVGTVG